MWNNKKILFAVIFFLLLVGCSKVVKKGKPTAGKSIRVGEENIKRESTGRIKRGGN